MWKRFSENKFKRKLWAHVGLKSNLKNHGIINKLILSLEHLNQLIIVFSFSSIWESMKDLGWNKQLWDLQWIWKYHQYVRYIVQR